jgi:hypothetical protein
MSNDNVMSGLVLADKKASDQDSAPGTVSSIIDSKSF